MEMLTFLILIQACKSYAAKEKEYKVTKAGLFEIPSQLIPIDTTKLVLDTNNINTTKPEDFFKLRKLQKLSLYMNKLTLFPDLEYVAKTLTWLNLGYNHIRWIPSEFINKLHLLEFLQINMNELKEFPDVSGSQNSLHTLQLDNNLFKIFPSLSIIGKSLQYIFLRNNQISLFPAKNALIRNRQQKKGLYVYLDMNKLKTIPPIVGVKVKLLSVRLLDNPLECNSSITWLFNLAKGNRVGRCRQPDHLYNQLLSKITVADLSQFSDKEGKKPQIEMKKLFTDVYSLTTKMIKRKTHGVIECIVECMNEIGCKTLNFNSNNAIDSLETNCHYSSPYKGLIYDAFPGSTLTGWDYYVVE